MENINTKEKGNELEKEFAKYMVKELGYSNYHIQYSVKGKLNPKGTAVDIIGIKRGENSKRLENMSFAFRIIFLMLIIPSAILMIAGEFNVSIFLLFASIISIVISIRNKNLAESSYEHGWVECKNLKTRANFNQISKMLREYKDYINTGDKELKITELFFVSTNGFVDNALKYAKDERVNCYEKDKNGNFIQTKFWNT